MENIYKKTGRGIFLAMIAAGVLCMVWFNPAGFFTVIGLLLSGILAGVIISGFLTGRKGNRQNNPAAEDNPDEQNTDGRLIPEGRGLRSIFQAFDTIHQAVAVLDDLDRVTAVNGCMLEILGISRRQLEGDSFFDNVKGALADDIGRLVKTYRANPGVEQSAFEHRLPGKTYLVKVVPVCNKGFYGGVVILVDNPDTSAGRLVEGISCAGISKDKFKEFGHCVRTYLNSIVGFSDYLAGEGLADQYAQIIQRIRSDAAVLVEATDKMLSDCQDKAGAGSAGFAQNISPAASRKSVDGTDNPAARQPMSCPNVPLTARAQDASQAQQVENRPAKSAQNTGESDTAILVVDDVVENRMLLDVVLRKAGYRVVAASNGKEAVDLAQKQKFSIILMDMKMPVMDGFTATRTIKSGGLNAKTPILAMTASLGSEGEDIACLQAGCDDSVSKPIRREQLLKKIWRFMQQTRQIQDAQSGSDIISYFRNDPDYSRTIEMFVNGLPDRIREMHEAFEKKDLKELGIKVHALKGLGSFAGFAVYTEKAKELEESIQSRQIDKIRQQLDEMTAMCMRTRLNPNTRQ